MRQKEFSTQADLEAHKRADWKTVHRIWEMIKAVIPVYGSSSLVHRQGGDYYAQPLIQIGVETLTDAGATVTFDHAFKAAPTITTNCETNGFVATAKTIGTTSFAARCWDDGVEAAGTFHWIAIGEKP